MHNKVLKSFSFGRLRSIWVFKGKLGVYVLNSEQLKR